MNILIYVSGDIDTNKVTPFPPKTCGAFGVQELASIFYTDVEANVVVCSKYDTIQEYDEFVTVPHAMIDDVIENNSWDVVISVGDNTGKIFQNKKLSSSFLVDWVDWYYPKYPEEIIKKVNFVVRSEFHKYIMEENFGMGEYCTVIPDLLPTFDGCPPPVERSGKPVFLYPSFYHCGLDNFLYLWPLILEENPDAELVVSAVCRDEVNANKYKDFLAGDKARKCLELFQFPNIKFIEESLEYSDVLSSVSSVVYPCDPVYPFEVSGISILYPLLMGIPCLCTPADCLKGYDKYGAIVAPFDPTIWKQLALGLTVTNKINSKSVIEKDFSHEKIRKMWRDLILDNLYDLEGSKS